MSWNMVAGWLLLGELLTPLAVAQPDSSFANHAPPRFVPGALWRDEAGNPVNAHGGGVIWSHGVYYWYGEHKLPGKSEKECADGGVHCYSSTNRCRWKDEGLVLSVKYNQPQSDLAYGCILERPKVLFNAPTHSFVLFFKYYPPGTGYDRGYVGVATADSPAGPFTYRHKFLAADSPKGSGDFAVHRDTNGVAYHLTVRKPDRAFCLGRLRDDYLFPQGPYHVLAGIPAETEAPAVLHANGKYYLLGSGSSGWKPNPARSFVANVITGPYHSTGNPCRGTNPHNGLGPDQTFGGQISFALPVNGTPETFIAMFDLWKPDMAFEGRYAWLPLRFVEGKPVVEWQDRWDLSDLIPH